MTFKELKEKNIKNGGKCLPVTASQIKNGERRANMWFSNELKEYFKTINFFSVKNIESHGLGPDATSRADMINYTAEINSDIAPDEIPKGNLVLLNTQGNGDLWFYNNEKQYVWEWVHDDPDRKKEPESDKSLCDFLNRMIDEMLEWNI